MTSGFYGTFAAGHFRNVPLIHLSLGEVTALPHKVFDGHSRLHWRAASLMSRRILPRAQAVIVTFPPEIQSLIRLGISDKARIWGFPEDVRGNPGRVDQNLLAELRAKYARFDRVLMWPSRLNFLNKNSEEYKGPEHFLEALERLLLRDRRNVRAVIGTHGYDVEAFQQLARSKGLHEHIDYIPHQAVYELLTYFSLPNVIVCDTISPERGILAGSAREAVSVGCVLVKSLDVAFNRLCFGKECPIDVVSDGPSCYAALTRLIDLDADAFAGRQRAIREWALAHLDTSRQIPKLMHIFQEVLYTEQLKHNAA